MAECPTWSAAARPVLILALVLVIVVVVLVIPPVPLLHHSNTPFARSRTDYDYDDDDENEPKTPGPITIIYLGKLCPGWLHSGTDDTRFRVYWPPAGQTGNW